jgi:hypothetical protein
MYKKYNYGCRKKEVKALINERLDLRKKVRHHEGMISKVNARVQEIEKMLEEYVE